MENLLSVMEGSSQDYICKSDFLKNVVSCLPNRQWIHQQALMDGGADDNLSFLEHSGANQMHFYGYILKLHVMKVLVMLENIHGFTLSQAQMQSCLCVSGAIYVHVGRGWIVSCHPCHVCLSKNHSFLWENELFLCPNRKYSRVVREQPLGWHFSGMMISFLSLSIWWRKKFF